MISLTKPYLDYREIQEDVRKIIESGRLTGGPYVESFEKLIAEYIGVKHAFSTTSATTALYLSLVAGGIKRGNEVLVSDFSFPATGNVVAQLEATPVFVDCKPGTFLIDVDRLERKLSHKTKAIMPVDPFGIPADMDRIEEIAKKHGLFVVEDAACALGAKKNGKHCGSWMGVGCFSFHPRKIITTGEGGIVTTNDDHIAERVTLLRNHGGIKKDIGLEFLENGFNYRMSEIQAALGVAQLKRIDSILEDRKATAGKYIQRLEGSRQIKPPICDPNRECTYQSFVVLLDEGVDRDMVISRMLKEGIEVTLGTYAMHSQKAFSKYGYRPGDLEHSWYAQQHSITLPLLPRMSDDAVDQVVSTLLRNIR